MNPNRRFWNEKIETLPPDQMKALQWNRLKQQLHYNYNHSIYFREEKFDKVGLTPDRIRTFKDFQKIPVMTKDEHRRVQEASIEKYGHPYGLITCAPLNRIVRINATSGTTGVPTLYTLTRRDVEALNEMHARKYWRAGLRPGHVVLQALSLSMFTGGLPLSDGLQAMGLCVVPVGIEGGTRRVLEFARLTRPDAIIATPSFGVYLIEKAPELVGKPARDLGFRWFFCAGEPGAGIPSLKNRLEEGFGARVFDHTGGGHAFHGISCPQETYQGMHFVSQDHCILELVDPKRQEPIPVSDGAIGEMVFTFISWEGGPFMRYALGDMIQVFTQPCDCGWPEMRFKILGRADDMLIVKGVNVYPAAVKELVENLVPRTTGVVKIMLNRPGPLVTPPLRITAEFGPGETTRASRERLKKDLEGQIRQQLRLQADVRLVPPGSIPRTSGKSSITEIEGEGSHDVDG